MSVEPTIFTTVTVPAVAGATGAAYDLADRETVKANLSISGSGSDDFLDRAISRASAAISNYCNRVFNLQTVQDLIFPASSYGPLSPHRSMIQLSNTPVVSVVSVTMQNATTTTSYVQNTDYVVDLTDGTLRRLSSDGLSLSYWERGRYTIVYQTGYSPIPQDILDAVCIVVRRALGAKDRDPALMEEHQDGLTRRYWVSSTDGGFFTEDARELIANYRAPVA